MTGSAIRSHADFHNIKPQPFALVSGKPRLDTKKTNTEIKFTYNRRTAFFHSYIYSSESFTSLKKPILTRSHIKGTKHDSGMPR